MSTPQQIRYADVFDRLLSELAAKRPDLRARTSDDFTVALADAWAVVAEILGFHTARQYEESCLDLAGELRSLIELSRLIGYRPDPGLAASASLAFTIDDAGAAEQVVIPTGTGVTSVPGPGETSATFETVQDIEARPAWNALRPRRSSLQNFTSAPTTVLLAGTATNVQPGDGMLVAVGSGRAFGLVSKVAVRLDDPPVPGTGARAGWTTVTLAVLGNELPVPSGDPATPAFNLTLFKSRGTLLQQLSPNASTILNADELQAAATTGGFGTADVFAALRATQRRESSVLVFRAQAGILGGAAPDFSTLPEATRDDFLGSPEPKGAAAKASGAAQQQVAQTATAKATAFGVVQKKLSTYSPNATIISAVGLTPVWATDDLATYPGAHAAKASVTRVFCDAVVRGARPEPIVLRDGESWRVVRVNSVQTKYASVFTTSGKSSVLTVNSHDLSSFSIRGTTVFLAGEELPLAAMPVTTTVPGGAAGSIVELDGWVDGLSSGRLVAITGRSATQPGAVIAHVSPVHQVMHELSPTGATSIELTDPLPDSLIRDSVVINANVAPATHGQHRSEILGSTSGKDPLPSFTLSGTPLTYVAGADGSDPALAVYVNGILRERVDALLDPDEPGYIVRQDDKQVSTIQFGSPLPTGVINARADYRVGLGAGAAVKAGQLSMLASRPPGVRTVTNPLPVRGGADPETVADARINAPVSIRALGRVVSLVDYADFARAYPGIAKSASIWVPVGRRRGVQVTVAGARGSEVTPDSDVYTGLLAAFTASSDELVPVSIAGCQRVPVRVGAALRIDPARIAADVKAAAAATLTAALSFAARDLGQPVSASEVIEMLQSVPGVLAANVRVLCRLVGGVPEDSITYRPYLRPSPPLGSSSTATVLLTLDPGSLTLDVVSR